MCEVYRIFSKEWSHTHDFSDNAMVELFNHESYGTKLSEKNGFALDKKWMNFTVAAWKEDIQAGLLFKIELLNDPTFPKWWIESVLSKNHNF